MTESETRFRLVCQLFLEDGRIPTPKLLGEVGFGNGRNINGRQATWRREEMEKFGCTRVPPPVPGVNGRWRLP